MKIHLAELGGGGANGLWAEAGGEPVAVVIRVVYIGGPVEARLLHQHGDVAHDARQAGVDAQYLAMRPGGLEAVGLQLPGSAPIRGVEQRPIGAAHPALGSRAEAHPREGFTARADVGPLGTC